MKYLILILSVLIISCTPQKKLARLVKKHPELVSTETIYKSDTTITEKIKTDSFFVSHQLTDTFTVVKDNIKYRIIKSFDTIRINIEVPADTIIKEIPITQNVVQPIEQKRSVLKNIFYGLLLIILLYIIINYYLKKYGKPRFI